MGNKSERLYGPEAQSVITRYLTDADKHKNAEVWAKVMRKITKEFGLYFGEIEQLLRENELSMQLLAVPVEMALKDTSDVKAANPNDETLPCGFIAFCLPNGGDSARKAAELWGVSYEPLMNMVNLHDAGIFIVKAGSETARQIMASLN